MILDAELVDDTKPCPFCGETIKQSAIKCRFCGEMIGSDECPGVFRHGKQLVMNRSASLPERCVKTNEPAERWLKRTVNWYPKLVSVLILLGPLPFLIGYVVTRKQARVSIPLSESGFRRRRRHILIAWLIALAGIGLLVAGVMNTNARKNDLVMWLCLSGVVSLLVAIVYGLLVANPLSATKMTDRFIWFKGVHPEFLNSLPDWPGDL